MSLRRLLGFGSLAVATLAIAASSAVGCAAPSEEDGSSSAAAVSERPPQFVLLAFDGSLNLDFWEESRAFAKNSGVKFTYFMSGPYFLPDAKKTQYHAPHHNAGASDIGFGGATANIPLRVQQVIDARGEGHEMASHANGHYDGTKWTEEDWDSEFSQFNDLIFKAAANGGQPNLDIGFGPSDVIGFRAPLLGQGPGLYKTLAKNHFAYDTSKTSATNYWPEKIGGVWNFPLAQVRIASGANQGKRTLSMDYNFYYTQSAGTSKPAMKDAFKKEMLDTYMTYFQSNYFGNRAPVHIGHHFSKWNGGAYWEAMQAFAQRVCNQPEVKCVTYKELTAFMEEHASLRAAYQRGDFTQMPRPPGVADAEPVEEAVPDDKLADEGMVGDSSEAHEEVDADGNLVRE